MVTRPRNKVIKLTKLVAALNCQTRCRYVIFAACEHADTPQLTTQIQALEGRASSSCASGRCRGGAGPSTPTAARDRAADRVAVRDGTLRMVAVPQSPRSGRHHRHGWEA